MLHQLDTFLIQHLSELSTPTSSIMLLPCNLAKCICSYCTAVLSPGVEGLTQVFDLYR